MIIPPPASPAESSIYRLKRGTKLSDIPPIPPNPPVPDLSSLNGPFQLAEYLSLKIKHCPHDVKGLVEVPVGDKSLGGKAPDKDVWIYEHLRRIPIDLTTLINHLLPICNQTTCPEMKAHEWLYLCSAHGGGAESCSAIDYILHTLDSTTALLNSSQNFPSRMQIPQSSVSHFPSLFRRLSRIFSHAYFHHREAFSLAEGETSLYARFVGLCEKYELVGNSLLPIPRDVINEFTNSQTDQDQEIEREQDGIKGTNEDDEDAEVEEDEEEEDDDDDDDDEDEDGNGDREKNADKDASDSRGRKEENVSNEKRTQSLDRSLPPSSTTSTSSSSSGSIPQPPGLNRNATLKPDSSGASSIKGGNGTNIGRGTLGRGKQPRATMHWGGSGDAPPLPSHLPENTSDSVSKEDTSPLTSSGSGSDNGPVKGRDRSESIESAIHLPSAIEPPEELKEENIVAAIPDILEPEQNLKNEGESERESKDSGDPEEGEEGEEEEELVGKDEIELLEEKGELPIESNVSPLSPSSSFSSTNTTPQEPAGHQEGEDEPGNGDENDELEEVILDNNKPTSDVKEETGPIIPTPTIIQAEDNKPNSTPSKIKNKNKSSPILSGSPATAAPSPVRGKGKLAPAEVSSPANKSPFKDSQPNKEKEKENEKENEKGDEKSGAKDESK
ncbi:uncharacterized protein IL334_001713 [Kwoniella shivajii]|uniref:Mob1 family protein n=1 Tax=Kwoniella shivajii TaxID=564305 RepID=A0ABZ1CSP9_9TREE|nr:hypothetical protein IL334_001713 [Kwoniella shivajii]